MRYVNCIVVVCVLFFFIPIAALAGSLNDPGAPDNVASAMYTLEDIYNRLNDGTAGAKREGAFTEPSLGPGSTGHTTDDIMGKVPSVDDAYGAGVADVASGKTFWGLKSGVGWGLKTGSGTITTYPAPVRKTGQTTPYATGDDGDLQKGVSWPSSRWTCYDAAKAEVACSDVYRATAADNMTGLQWTINANIDGPKNWSAALIYCNGLDHGGYSDWRLPNRFELESLLDMSQTSPALPSQHPFTSVQPFHYWSSTTSAGDTNNAWLVDLPNGVVSGGVKTVFTYYVWPVRAGQ